MSAHGSRAGRAVVRLRWPIVVAWVAAAALATSALPTIEEAQSGALGDLVPASSAAAPRWRRRPSG